MELSFEKKKLYILYCLSIDQIATFYSIFLQLAQFVYMYLSLQMLTKLQTFWILFRLLQFEVAIY